MTVCKVGIRVSLIKPQTKELKIYRNGNSAKSLSYAENSKEVEELFTLTLNGVAVSVQHVFSTPVILHAELNDYLLCMEIDETMRSK